MAEGEAVGNKEPGRESPMSICSIQESPLLVQETLRERMEKMAALHKDTFEYELMDSSDVGLANDLGLDDAIFAYNIKGQRKKHCTILLMVKQDHLLPQDGDGCTLPTSPADPRLLIKYFNYYRLLVRNFIEHYPIRAIDEIVVYWCGNSQVSENPEAIDYTEHFLEVTTETDPLLENSIMKFKRDYSLSRSIALGLKNDWVKLPDIVAQSLFGGALPCEVSEATGGDQLLYQSYMDSFRADAYDPGAKGFTGEFVLGERMSSAAQHFRDQIEFVFRCLNDESGDNVEADFQAYLCRAKIRLEGNVGNLEREDFKLDFAKALATALVDTISRGGEEELITIESNDVFLRDQMTWLIDFVLISLRDHLVFRREFIEGKWMPERFMILRHYLICELKRRKISYDSLEYLKFKIRDHDGSKFETKYYGDLVEVFAEDYMTKIKFAIGPQFAESDEEGENRSRLAVALRRFKAFKRANNVTSPTDISLLEACQEISLKFNFQK